MTQSCPKRAPSLVRLPARLLLGAALLVLPAAAAQAQSSFPRQILAQLLAQGSTPEPADTEDVAEGATIVRGKYAAGEVKADWEAAVQKGKPERIAEWRDYGENGNANVVFSFHNGDLMHYAEHGRRRGGQAGSMDGFRRVELNLSFANGRYTGGSKTIDGIETEPTDAEIRGANVQALAALERLAVAKPAWQDSRQMGFSMTSIPQPAGPSEEARRLAGAGGEIVFRCSDTLSAVLGAAQDRLVVETQGRSPVTLMRQAPGAAYDYFGAGWGAQRRGEEIRLEEASGRAMLCRIVSAAAPPSSLPPGAAAPGAPASGEPPPPPFASSSDDLPTVTIPPAR